MKLIHRIVCIGLGIVLTIPVFGKTITVKWKEVKGAAQYEIVLLRGEAEVVHRTVPGKDLSLSCFLEPGFYYFHVRGVDRLKRPGKWSRDQAIVVTPQPPKQVAPEENARLTYSDNESRRTASWQESAGAHRYLFEIHQERRKVYAEMVDGTSTRFRELPAGRYQWRVKALVEASGDITSELEDKVGSLANSAPSAWRTVVFEGTPGVTVGTNQPLILYPKGPVLPPGKDGTLTLVWQPVEGAVAYEVNIREVATGNRGPAALPPFQKTARVDESELTVSLPPQGSFVWSVRALSSIKDKRYLGTTSTMEFQLDPNASGPKGSSRTALEVSMAMVPYHLRVYDDTREGQISAAGFYMGGKGTYWLTGRFGTELEFGESFYSINSQLVDQKSARIAATVRGHLFGDFLGYTVALGPGYQDYFSIVPDSPTGQIERFGLLGPDLFFELRLTLLSKLSTGFQGDYFYPVSAVTVTDGGTLKGDGRASNYRVSAFLRYSLGPSLGLGLRASYQKKVMSFTSPSQTGLAQSSLDLTPLLLDLMLSL